MTKKKFPLQWILGSRNGVTNGPFLVAKYIVSSLCSPAEERRWLFFHFGEGHFVGKFGRRSCGIFSDPQNKGSKMSGNISEHFRERIRDSKKSLRANFVLQACHPDSLCVFSSPWFEKTPTSYRRFWLEECRPCLTRLRLLGRARRLSWSLPLGAKLLHIIFKKKIQSCRKAGLLLSPKLLPN